MRFYLDENLSQQIAALARQLSVDAVSSHECGNDGGSDAAQLAYAAMNEFCLVTNDHDDFLSLAGEYARLDRLHSGILLLSPSLMPEEKNFRLIAQALKRYSDLYPGGPYHHTDWLHR